jgi:hypothetical protein
MQEVFKLVFMSSNLSLDELKTLYSIISESPHHKKMADETINDASGRFEELKKIIGVKT